MIAINDLVTSADMRDLAGGWSIGPKAASGVKIGFAETIGISFNQTIGLDASFSVAKGFGINFSAAPVRI